MYATYNYHKVNHQCIDETNAFLLKIILCKNKTLQLLKSQYTTLIKSYHVCHIKSKNIPNNTHVTHIKCIVTNKYASRVLEYNTDSQKICVSHFNSKDFINKCDVSVLLGHTIVTE